MNFTKREKQSRSAEIRWKSKRYSENVKEFQTSNAKRKC